MKSNRLSVKLPAQLLGVARKVRALVEQHSLLVIMGVFSILLLMLLAQLQSARATSRNEADYELILSEQPSVTLNQEAIDKVKRRASGQDLSPQYGGRTNPFDE